MKTLDGSELAGYVKERQAKQVRALKQAWKVFPRLAIVQTTDNPVIDAYVRLKQSYGDDIGVTVDHIKIDESEVLGKLKEINLDESIQGVIVQLPLEDTSKTDEVVAGMAPEKDVDGLNPESSFISATATAIDWLLAGYNVDLRGKQIAIVGNGRLVGAPLAKLWSDQGLNVSVYDVDTSLDDLIQKDIIVTATGQPGVINSDMVKPGAVVVDAGTTSENGKLVGDVDESIRGLDDITITPVKGGVGPLTIAALFDNLITAARRVADKKD